MNTEQLAQKMAREILDDYDYTEGQEFPELDDIQMIAPYLPEWPQKLTLTEGDYVGGMRIVNGNGHIMYWNLCNSSHDETRPNDCCAYSTHLLKDDVGVNQATNWVLIHDEQSLAAALKPVIEFIAA